MENNNRHSEFIQRILMHFIHAGCTALALALSCVFGGSWLFYFILLLPFLYRISNTDTADSAISGGFLAVSLLLVIFPGNLINRPLTFALVVLLQSATIVMLSVLISKFKRYFILSLVLYASLCFPLAHLLKAGIGSHPAVYYRISSIGFAYKATVLLGFLFLSLFTLAINSLLLILIDILCRLPFAGRHYRLITERVSGSGKKVIALLKYWKFLPNLRAPPLVL